MKKFLCFYFLAIILFVSKLKCYTFDDNQYTSTILPEGPQINLNYTHAKFMKICEKGTCTYNLDVPGMSNQISDYIKKKIDDDKIIEATDETITKNLDNNITVSLNNIQDNVDNIQKDLDDLMLQYNKLVVDVETIEVNLEKSNDSFISIQAYIDEMNQTANDNDVNKCYVNAFENCSQQPSSTVSIPLGSTLSPFTSTLYALSTNIPITVSTTLNSGALSSTTVEMATGQTATTTISNTVQSTTNNEATSTNSVMTTTSQTEIPTISNTVQSTTNNEATSTSSVMTTTSQTETTTT